MSLQTCGDEQEWVSFKHQPRAFSHGPKELVALKKICYIVEIYQFFKKFQVSIILANIKKVLIFVLKDTYPMFTKCESFSDF